MTQEALRRPERLGQHGRLIILTGATASGKTDIKTALEKRGIRRIVTATTRDPRTSEVPGLDYHFFTREQFEDHRKNGKLVEWTDYNGHYYGTPKSELEPIFSGEHLITSTEIQGAVDFTGHIEKAYDREHAQLLLAQTSLVLVGIDSLQTARSRFLAREGNSQKSRDNFRSRLRAEWEMWNNLHHKFDHIIYNRADEFEKAVEEIHTLFRG